MRDERDELYELCVIQRGVMMYIGNRDPELAERDDLVAQYGSLEEAERYRNLERREKKASVSFEERLKCAKARYYAGK